MKPVIIALAIVAIVGILALVTWGPDQSTPIITLSGMAITAIAGLAGWNAKAPDETPPKR